MQQNNWRLKFLGDYGNLYCNYLIMDVYKFISVLIYQLSTILIVHGNNKSRMGSTR